MATFSKKKMLFYQDDALADTSIIPMAKTTELKFEFAFYPPHTLSDFCCC